jgi:uncharacterized protein involved in response to NO
MAITTPAGHGATTDPYRVFFPLGILMGIAGVSIWPLFHWGVTSGYSGQSHAFIQTNCFLYAFIVGFLWTAVPRFTGTNAPGRAVQYFLAAILIAELIAFELYYFTAGHVLFVIAHVTFVAVVINCFLQRQHPPPETFVFVGLGLMAGLAASVINAASALTWISPAWQLPGKRLLTEGMVLLLVLGVGGFLGPRLLGFAQLPNFQNLEKLSDRKAVSWLLKWRSGFNAVCGLFLVASVVVEYGWNYTFVVWLRAVITTAVALVNVQPWRLPTTRTTLAWCVWVAHWLLIASLWLVAVFENNHIDFLHVMFMGAFTLLILAVGTRVVLSHGGYTLTEERRSWPLRIGLTATLIAISARLSAIIASTPHSYFSHLAWAAIVWIAGIGLWGIYLFRRIWIHQRGTERGT